MTHIDPRNPDPTPLEPTRLDGGRRPDLDPATDPRLARSTSGNWGLIGGLGAVLVLGLVIFSMMGGQPAGDANRTGATQTSQPAPAVQPAPDTTTTGSVPRPQLTNPPAAQPAPGSAPAPTAPESTPRQP